MDSGIAAGSSRMHQLASSSAIAAATIDRITPRRERTRPGARAMRERRSDGELAAPLLAAREQKIAKISAHQQHQQERSGLQRAEEVPVATSDSRAMGTADNVHPRFGRGCSSASRDDSDASSTRTPSIVAPASAAPQPAMPARRAAPDVVPRRQARSRVAATHLPFPGTESFRHDANEPAYNSSTMTDMFSTSGFWP